MAAIRKKQLINFQATNRSNLTNEQLEINKQTKKQILDEMFG